VYSHPTFLRFHVKVAVNDLGPRLRPAAYLPHLHPLQPARLPLPVKSRTGYKNLCRLITRFKLRESKKAEGAALLRDFEEYGEGLVCLTGGSEGPLAAALAQSGYDSAQNSVERLIGIFGPRNMYVEVHRHFDREEERRNRAAIRIARSLNLPLLASGGVNYATPYEREVLDVFTCIRHGRTLDTAGRLLTMNAERHLRSARERAIQYVYQRYAELGAAMTAHVTTYRSRSASREPGKALGFDKETAGRLASLVGAWEWKGPNDNLENTFKAAGFDLRNPAIESIWRCVEGYRISRVISASTRAAWSFARAILIPSYRSSGRRWPDAPSCNGTKTTART
jgi:DNA polymerase III alpha subunit